MEIQSREFRMRWSDEIYPAKVAIEIRRSSPKIEITDSSIVNFSRQGMFVQTQDHLGIQVGSQFDFALQSNSDGQDIRGKAEVKWVRPIAINSRKPPGIGLHFVNFSDHSEENYHSIFESCLLNLTVDEVYLKDIPTINLQTELLTVVRIFQAFPVETLVVVDKGVQPVGVLFQTDLFQEIGVKKSKQKRISDLLRPISQSLDPCLRVSETFSSLKSGVRFDIPVIHQDRYLGILPIDLVLNYWSAYSEVSYQKILKNYEKSLFEIAHDLRQPIGYIMMVQYLLKSGELSLDEYKKSNFHEGIERNCNNMLTMIEDILDLPRLRCGHVKVVNKAENIKEILGAIVVKNRQLAAKNSMDIKLEMATNLDDYGAVLIDSRRLEQVLNNLLSNAVRYSKSSTSIIVGVSVEEVSCEDRRLIIKVIDSGIGIAPEHLNSLFKEGSIPFDRDLHGKESTGLGLSIVKKILMAMGGDIEVNSRLGKGTTFTFVLPLKKVNTPESSIV